ncbi:sensor histidine kinase [Flindersiella endophytica]
MNDPGRRRNWRDWVADIGLVLFAALYAAVVALLIWDDPTVSDRTLYSHLVVAGVSCVVLWFRRRWPVGVALVLLPLATFADLSAGAQLAALFTVAIHRRWKLALAICASNILLRSVFLLTVPGVDEPISELIGYVTITSFAVLGWGLFIRHRRQLIASLRDRAARAEVEAALRAEQAQHRAREQIAREMHDVLGHRLSLLSVHAGALAYRPDASASEVSQAAEVIRASAHQALQDLRSVIGVLRAPAGDLPQPTLADVHALVADAVRAGTLVDLRSSISGEVPDGPGRTAYRIVQEGLTNVRRHAPGASVVVVVQGAAGDGLTVEVTNTATSRRGDEALLGSELGSGQGLIGLAERVALAAGRLEYGPGASGGFRLAAWLPWPA